MLKAGGRTNCRSRNKFNGFLQLSEAGKQLEEVALPICPGPRFNVKFLEDDPRTEGVILDQDDGLAVIWRRT